MQVHIISLLHLKLIKKMWFFPTLQASLNIGETTTFSRNMPCGDAAEEWEAKGLIQAQERNANRIYCAHSLESLEEGYESQEAGDLEQLFELVFA